MPINRQGAFLCGGAGRCVLWIDGYGPAGRNLCEEFAPRDGAARVSGEGGANRASKHPARGSRPKIENKGLAGSRARTMPVGGPTLLTGGPASMPGGPIPLSADPPRPSPEPALLPSGPGPNKKTPGGSPAFSPILLILSSLLFQRTQIDSLESFQVRFQQRKHF